MLPSVTLPAPAASENCTTPKQTANESVTLKLLAPSVKTTPQKKKSSIKKRITRISPFLLLAVFIYTLAPLSYFTNTGGINNGWLLLGMLCFAGPNIILLDFALWNYFEGKKKALIWSVETFLSALVIYFVV